MKYGLYDKDDDCWLGTTTGPSLYDDEGTGTVAAEVISRRLKWPMDRIQVKPFTGASKKKDEIEPPVSIEEAVDGYFDRLESGGRIQTRLEDEGLRKLFGLQNSDKSA